LRRNPRGLRPGVTIATTITTLQKLKRRKNDGVEGFTRLTLPPPLVINFHIFHEIVLSLDYNALLSR
jgi:hypothetical protein